MHCLHQPTARAACKAALVATLAALGACASIEPPNSLIEDGYLQSSEGGPRKPFARGTKPAPGLDHYAGVREAYKKAVASPQNSKVNAVFLTEGMALVQSNCSAYFTRLGSGAQHLGFARKETSLAGGLTAAVMGLAEASATAISATASAFGFTTATMDNFSEAYLFAPDIRATQDLVMSALEAQRFIGAQIIQDVADKNQSLSFTQASQFLLEMETYCQPHGIRSLVTSAVNSQRVVPASEANKAVQTTTTLLSKQTNETFQSLATPLKLSPERSTDKPEAKGPPGQPAANPRLPVPVQPPAQPSVQAPVPPPLPQAGGSAPQAGGSAPQAGGSASQAGGSASQAGGAAPQAGGAADTASPAASEGKAAFPAPSAMRSQSLILQSKTLQNP